MLSLEALGPAMTQSIGMCIYQPDITGSMPHDGLV